MKSLICALIIASILIFCQSARAGAPEGYPPSMDDSIQSRLKRSLETEGYSRWGIDSFTQSISAYLWDHRNMIKDYDIPNSRVADLAMCIMSKKGNKRFEEFTRTEMFRKWCDAHVKEDTDQ